MLPSFSGNGLVTVLVSSRGRVASLLLGVAHTTPIRDPVFVMDSS